LSICMSIIREHGGSIDVETLPAGGTAFTVYLPVAPEEETASAPEAGAAPETAAPVGEMLKGRSILVLDDEESIRMLLDEGLSAQGMRVDGAATPREAVDLARQRAYDVLICDLNLSASGFASGGPEAMEQILSAAPGASKPDRKSVV